MAQSRLASVEFTAPTLENVEGAEVALLVAIRVNLLGLCLFRQVCRELFCRFGWHWMLSRALPMTASEAPAAAKDCGMRGFRHEGLLLNRIFVF